MQSSNPNNQLILLLISEANKSWHLFQLFHRQISLTGESMNLCGFTRFQGIFGEISFDSYDEMMDVGEGEKEREGGGGEGEIEEGELVEVEKEGGEVEKEGGETKKKKRKGNKEDRRRQADDSWMAGAISNGRVNLEERDPSRAPVRRHHQHW